MGTGRFVLVLLLGLGCSSSSKQNGGDDGDAGMDADAASGDGASDAGDDTSDAGDGGMMTGAPDDAGLDADVPIEIDECAVLADCIDDCGDKQDCIDVCESAVGIEARNRFQALDDCVASEEDFFGKCTAEALACLNPTSQGDALCAEALDCFDTCGGAVCLAACLSKLEDPSSDLIADVLGCNEDEDRQCQAAFIACALENTAGDDSCVEALACVESCPEDEDQCGVDCIGKATESAQERVVEVLLNFGESDSGPCEGATAVSSLVDCVLDDSPKGGDASCGDGLACFLSALEAEGLGPLSDCIAATKPGKQAELAVAIEGMFEFSGCPPTEVSELDGPPRVFPFLPGQSVFQCVAGNAPTPGVASCADVYGCVGGEPSGNQAALLKDLQEITACTAEASPAVLDDFGLLTECASTCTDDDKETCEADGELCATLLAACPPP